MSPAFVRACRWMLANGWTVSSLGCLVHDDGDKAIGWDWFLRGAAATNVAPPGAQFFVEYERVMPDGQWRKELEFIPHSVGQAINYLIAAGMLPLGLLAEVPGLGGAS